MADRRAVGPMLSREDSVEVAARVALGFHVRAMMREELRARRGEIEGIHQLRVATRRVRATLALFGPVLPAATVRSTDAALAAFGHAVGDVRDCDVLVEALAARARDLDPTLRDALAPVLRGIGTQRGRALATMVQTLDAAGTRRLLAKLEALAASGARPRRSAALGEVATTLVQPLHRQFLRAGGTLGDAPTADALHRLRVRGKRLRYGLETLATLGGPAVARAIRRLVRLQDVLGAHQDAVTQAAWVREHADGRPTMTMLAMGAVLQANVDRARRARRRFPRRWARASDRALWRTVTEELGGSVR